MSTNPKDSMKIGFALVWGALILLLFTCIRLFGAALIYEKDNQKNKATSYSANDIINIENHLQEIATPLPKPKLKSAVETIHVSDALPSHGDASVIEDAYGSYESTNNSYSNEDVEWLAAIINAEARGEPFEGMLAVGTVVLNRTESCLFPDTVKEVILDCRYGVQFSPVADGSIKLPPTNESISAAILCLQGFRTDPDILFFYNPSLSDSTYFKENRTYEFRIGNHEFYS